MKNANRLYALVGIIMPIFVGILHLFAHFKDLIKPATRQLLQKEIIILGEPQTLWSAWGVMSFMMGAAFITIGLLNISLLRNSAKGHPPFTAILAMGVYLLSVIYVGYEFNQAFQFYGGIFGLLVLLLCGFVVETKK